MGYRPKSDNDYKESVRVSPNVAVTIASPGASLDGVTMAVGDRVLLRGQGAGADNGIYVWNGAAVPMTRALDADDDSEVTSGLTVFVEKGTNAETTWVLITADPITVGATTLSFRKVIGKEHAATHLAGGGDEVDGDRLDVDWAPSRYVRDSSPPEAVSGSNLTAHLKGIDNALEDALAPPFYSCYVNSPQNSVASPGWNTIGWDVEVGDQKFAETVGSAIQVPSFGAYLIITQVAITPATATGTLRARVTIGGSEVAVVSQQISNTNAIFMNLTTFNSVTPANAVRVEFNHTTTGASPLAIGATNTWLRIVKMSA